MTNSAPKPHVRVPVVIANPKPFRLILRDGEDRWSCSTEEINNSTYDYVKLHRASRFMDANLIDPFTLCLGYDGSLLLPLVEPYADPCRALDEFNRIVACCFVGGLFVEAVAPADMAFGHLAKCGYYRHEQTFGDNANFHRALGERAAGPFANIRLYDPPCILASDFEQSYQRGQAVLSLVPTLSPVLLVTAYSYFRSMQLRESLSHCWVAIEQTLATLWTTIVVKNATACDVPNRKKFLESQQWNSAHRIEVLHQLGLVQTPLYKLLSVARRSRNAFLHKGHAPSAAAVRSGLEGLAGLLHLVADESDVGYDEGLIKAHLGTSPLRSGTVAMSQYDKVTAETASHWMAPQPIPGFSKWCGEYETFPDICLEPLVKLERDADD